MLSRVNVELASGGLRSLFVIVTSSVLLIRDIEEFCVHVMSSRARLKSEKDAVNIKSSPTSKVMLSLTPATGAATVQRICITALYDLKQKLTCLFNGDISCSSSLSI